MIRRACIVMVALAVCYVPSVMAEDEENKLDHFVFRGFLSWATVSGEETNVGSTTPLVFQGTVAGDVCEFTEDCFSMSMGEGSGYQANFEFRATQLLGIEIGGWTAKIDGQLFANVAVQDPRQSPLPCRTTVPGGSDPAFDAQACLFTNIGSPFDEEVQTDMFYVGINFHVWKKNSALDVYVGPYYGEMQYDDGTISVPDQDLLVFDEDGNPVPIPVPGVNLAFSYEDEEAWGLNGGFDVAIGKHWIVGGTLRYAASDPTMTLVNVDTGNVVNRHNVKVNPFIFSLGGGIKF